MTISKGEKAELEMLVEDIPVASLDIDVPKRGLTKKRIRRIAEPHLRAHRVKGRIYYCYVRGTDREIYLGECQHYS